MKLNLTWASLYSGLTGAPSSNDLHSKTYYVAGVTKDLVFVKFAPLLFVSVFSFPFLMAWKLRGSLLAAEMDLNGELFMYNEKEEPVGKHEFTSRLAWEVFWVGKVWMGVRTCVGMFPGLKEFFKSPSPAIDSTLFLGQELFLCLFGLFMAPIMNSMNFVTLTPNDPIAAQSERQWIIVECALKTVINFVLVGIFLHCKLWSYCCCRAVWRSFASFRLSTYIFVQMGFHVFLDVCQQLVLLAVTALANANFCCCKKDNGPTHPAKSSEFSDYRSVKAINHLLDDNGVAKADDFASREIKPLRDCHGSCRGTTTTAFLSCRVYKDSNEWNIPFERCFRKLHMLLLVTLATREAKSPDGNPIMSRRAQRAIMRLHDLTAPMDTFRDSRGLLGCGLKADVYLPSVVIFGAIFGAIFKAWGSVAGTLGQ